MQVGSSASNIQFIGSGSSSSVAKNLSTTDDFSFWDVLDIINPLQHIPVLSNIYREISGDIISPVAKIVGSTLFGGPIGGGIAIASEIAKNAMGDGKSKEVQVAAASEKAAFEAAASTYNRVRVTTADWLNPHFDANAPRTISNIA